jgi:AraC family transcriptional regulator, transcriptional activator of pobA
MVSDKLNSMYAAVCEAPSGNGFRVEHMPEMFASSSVDDCCPHVHSFYEILWFQEGRGRHMVDFADCEVVPNTIFFLSPGQIHHFDVKEGYRGVAIKMCTDFMKDEREYESLMVKYNLFYPCGSTACYTVDSQTAAVLGQLVAQMEDEAPRAGEFGNIDILKSLVRVFLVKALRCGGREADARVEDMKPAHALFLQFRRLVENEYKSMHTVQEYADRLNVAVRTLNKCVNDYAQMSPLAFVNSRIVLEARRMVRYSGLMFKEIASELGFEEPSYFVKFFKRQTGYLPSEFRERDEVAHCIVKK